MSTDGETIDRGGRVIPSPGQIAARSADRRTPKEKDELRARATHFSACARCQGWRSGPHTLRGARRAFRDHVAEAHPVEDETRDRALELVRQGGKSYRAIAAEVGVGSASTVRRWAVNAGVG